MVGKEKAVSEETVKADIGNVIAVLKALDGVMPGKLDRDLIEALEAVEGNEFLLALMTAALGKL